MPESANSSTPLRGDRGRTHRTIAVVFALGIGLYGYGLAVAVGLLPAGWGIFGVVQYVFLTVGALLVSLMILVVWFWRRDSPRSFTRNRATRASLVASVMALVAVIVSYWLRIGEFSLPQFLDWTALGLLVLALQFPLGTVKPKCKRRLLLLAESVLVFAFVFGFLTIDRGDVHLVSYLFVSSGASAVLLLFGGPLYLLGSRLYRSAE